MFSIIFLSPSRTFHGIFLNNFHVTCSQGSKKRKNMACQYICFWAGDINFSLPFLNSQNSQVSYIVVRVKINIFMYLYYFYCPTKLVFNNSKFGCKISFAYLTICILKIYIKYLQQTNVSYFCVIENYSSGMQIELNVLWNFACHFVLTWRFKSFLSYHF